MEVKYFIEKHLGEYKKHGDEYVIKNCPFCQGGRHNDKNTFSINDVKMTYYCQRGKCNVRGHYNELLKKFGESTVSDNNRGSYEKTKKYKLPQQCNSILQDDAIKYAALRCISKSTLEAFNVTQKENLFVFNYYDENNVLTFQKYRPIGKITDERKKSWREKDTKPILYNMNNININEPVVITEGEFDAMAVYEAGYKNVVSVPSGCKDFDWIESCWDWLNTVNEFVIYGDNDEAGIDMIKILVKKLGESKTKIAKHDHKDANEELFKEKKDNKILENIKRAILETPPGILRVSEIKKKPSEETIPTGIEGIDRILEYCQLGELTVWTGKNGAGKSTILGQVILSAIDKDVSVFCYSGELTKERFKHWIDIQAAGSNFIDSYKNEFGDIKYIVKSNAIDKITAWYSGKLFLYDNDFINTDNEQSDIISKCEIAYRKFNCKLFVIDNLMTSDFKTNSNNDYYRAQSDFVGQLVKFTKKYNVHVHLVAHPKKVQGSLDKDSIQGSGDITNRADNVLSLERVDDNNKDKEISFDYDAVIRILKNRNTGVLGELYLKYSVQEKSYLQLDKAGNIKHRDPYKWSCVEPGFYQVDMEECPF